MEKEKKMISAGNLPDEFKILDVRSYVKTTRKSILIKARENCGLNIKEVARRVNVDLDELKRIESGNVNESDMMLIHSLSELYEIDYLSLLRLFKLAEQPGEAYGMAAYHDKTLDEKTVNDIRAIVDSLKGKLK